MSVKYCLASNTTATANFATAIYGTNCGQTEIDFQTMSFCFTLIIVGICGQTELVTSSVEYGINPVLLVIFIKGILL